MGPAGWPVWLFNGSYLSSDLKPPPIVPDFVFFTSWYIWCAKPTITSPDESPWGLLGVRPSAATGGFLGCVAPVPGTHISSQRGHPERGAARNTALQGAIIYWLHFKTQFPKCMYGSSSSWWAQSSVCAHFQRWPSSSQ